MRILVACLVTIAGCEPAPKTLDLGDYSKGCEVNADCACVFFGEVCCLQEEGAISVSELDKYQADATSDCRSPEDGEGCFRVPRCHQPECVDGRCGLGAEECPLSNDPCIGTND